jgi:hypothetical protein
MKVYEVVQFRQNNSLKSLVIKENNGITPEYFIRSIPQQNGKVEQYFSTLSRKIRSLILTSGMNLEYIEKCGKRPQLM